MSRWTTCPCVIGRQIVFTLKINSVKVDRFISIKPWACHTLSISVSYL